MDTTTSTIDPKGKTPAQITRAFLQAYTAADVQEQLWQIFMGYVNGKPDEGMIRVPETEVALLFDDLTALVTAIETREQTSSRQAAH